MQRERKVKKTGWKTWVAAGLSVVYGVVGFLVGLHDVEAMMGFIVAGLGLVGLGHKIEKSSG